jgi:hypothetical protein
MLKKWLCFLLAFGLMNTQVWAQDDDDDDEEYEEAPKAKKAAPKKAAKKSSESGPSRFGLQVSFSGNLNTVDIGSVGFVYDLGNGMELGLGLGVYREQRTMSEIPEGAEQPEAVQSISITPSFSYDLGKGLLDYGIGVDVAVVMEPKGGRRPDGGNSFYGFPNFYAKAELVKNVLLKVSAGVIVGMEAEVPSSGEGAYDGYKDMTIQLSTSGTVIFYFM